MKKIALFLGLMVLGGCASNAYTPNGLDLTDVNGYIVRQVALDERLIPKEAETHLYFKAKPNSKKVELLFGAGDLPAPYKGKMAFQSETTMSLIEEVCLNHPNGCFFKTKLNHQQ